MARDIEKQETNYGSSNWVSTRTVREVRGPRFHFFATQFILTEFKGFSKIFVVEHMPIAPYHPRSNDQAERFLDIFKRALKNSNGESTKAVLQQFLQVYRLTPNKNVPSVMSPAEIVFARKIRSVFDKLIPNKKKVEHTVQKTGNKFYEECEKFFTKCIRQEKGIRKLELHSKESL